MLQASLRAYFRKDYKGGGVFEHEAYEHYAPEWCWIHKSSGIKARDRRHLTRFVTPPRCDAADSVQPRQLLAGVAGCPGPDSVRWKWRSGLLLSLHDSVGVPQHYCSTEGGR